MRQEAVILDIQHLKDVTLDEIELMCEVLQALLDDTKRQAELIGSSLQDREIAWDRVARVAHYCKSACANCGANATAATFKKMELAAASRDLASCKSLLATLATDLENLSAKLQDLQHQTL